MCGTSRVDAYVDTPRPLGAQITASISSSIKWNQGHLGTLGRDSTG